MNELKKFRKTLNLSLGQFAKRINVSESLLIKVESCKRKASREFITKIKKEFPTFDANIFFNNS